MVQKWLRPKTALRIFLAVIFIFVFASGLLFYFWGQNLYDYFSHMPLCPLRTFTGMLCPACGLARAFLLLGQLKIKEALILNPLSLPLLILIFFYVIRGRLPLWVQNKLFLKFILFAVFLFWIMRLF